MSDTIDQLRRAAWFDGFREGERYASAEIERLRAEIDRLQKHYSDIMMAEYASRVAIDESQDKA